MFCFPLDFLQVLFDNLRSSRYSFIILSVSNGNTTSQITKSCCCPTDKKLNHKFSRTLHTCEKKGFFCVVVRFIDWFANHNLPHITSGMGALERLRTMKRGSPYDSRVCPSQKEANLFAKREKPRTEYSVSAAIYC